MMGWRVLSTLQQYVQVAYSGGRAGDDDTIPILWESRGLGSGYVYRLHSRLIKGVFCRINATCCSWHVFPVVEEHLEQGGQGGGRYLPGWGSQRGSTVTHKIVPIFCTF